MRKSPPDCCLDCVNQECFGDSDTFPPERKYEAFVSYDIRGGSECAMRETRNDEE